MGYGDEIIGTGIVRRTRLIAPPPPGWKVGFGNGAKISWSHWAPEMFANNPFIAKPGEERTVSCWIPHFKGSRLYNKWDEQKKRWLWNYDFNVEPGEFFFSEVELIKAGFAQEPFVVIEPNLPWHKPVAVNKDWGEENWIAVARKLTALGWPLVQFQHKHTRRVLPGVKLIPQNSFRSAISMLSRARLYIGPEGGLHHAAAAVGVKAVVLFGGFIPPAVMGYGSHINLVGNSSEACGNTNPCEHCRSAMQSIIPDDVVGWARWSIGTW